MNTMFRFAAVAASCAFVGPPASAFAQGGGLGGVGSIVTGATDQVTSTLDQVLGGTEGVLSEDALGTVLQTVTDPVAGPDGGPGGSDGSGGSGGSGGSTLVSGAPSGVTTTVPSGGPGAADRSAPVVTVRVVSRLAHVARTRRLRLEVRSEEAGVVALASTIRPGVKRRSVAKGVKHRRSVIHVPTVVLAFRQAGTLTVELRLKAADAARLGRSRDGRMSVGLLTADVARNQRSERFKRHLRR